MVVAVVIILVLGFAMLNAIAYMHAYRMTHFTAGGGKTGKPEEMPLWKKAAVVLTGVNIPRPAGDWRPADDGLQAEDVELRSADGTRLAAWHIQAGRGRGIVVVLHGYGTCKAYMGPEVRLFHELGWDVLAVDFRGSGGSDGNETSIGSKEAMDVAAAAKWAREEAGGREVVLYGTSMGAVAVLHAVHQGLAGPDRIILECPFDTLLNTVRHRFEAMGLPSFPAAQLLVFWGGFQHGFRGFSLNGVDYAASVKCPCLLLHGRDDPRVTVDEVTAIRDRLAGPVRMHVFDAAGHESYCAANPDEYRAVVQDWLLAGR